MEKSGVASGVFNTARETGGSLGIVIIGAVLAAAQQHSATQGAAHAFASGYARGLAVAAGLALIAAVIAVLTLGQPRAKRSVRHAPLVPAVSEIAQPSRRCGPHPRAAASVSGRRALRPVAGGRRVGPIDKEARMGLARVVSFDGVTQDRLEELRRQMSDGEPPEGLPAKEIIVLHDPEGEKSLVILFFETEDDYRRGDETLNAMATDDTPGQRTSVARYDVAIRMAV